MLAGFTAQREFLSVLWSGATAIEFYGDVSMICTAVLRLEVGFLNGQGKRNA